MKKGFTLIELLIVVAIIAILAAIAVPNFLEAQVRSKVSRVKTDQRSLATGIEAYYVDNNQYPVSARTGRQPCAVGNMNSYLLNPGTLAAISSFSAQNAAAPKIMTLTTPIAYITSLFTDPFMDNRAATFGYYSDTNGWILFSPGPDTDAATNTDLGQANAVETVYNSNYSQPSNTLIVYRNDASPNEAYTYDPTNGTVSPGDIWRVKQ